jgi:hypothetical protein
MVTDIVQKVKRWSRQHNLPGSQEIYCVKTAMRYQTGESLTPRDEKLIIDILDDMNPAVSKKVVPITSGRRLDPETGAPVPAGYPLLRVYSNEKNEK